MIADIATEILYTIAEEWKAQGHDLTGDFIKSLRFEITNGDTIKVYGNHYGAILDAGVTPDQIKYPFAKKRIEGLTDYAKIRLGASDKDAISIAFAIATKHAREGMPLPSSKRFSKTGKRTGFIEDAEKKFKPIIENIIKNSWQ